MADAAFTRFLSQFFARPGSVGAIAPSSVHLARAMVEWIDWPLVNAVVEYGPGTGAFTGTILAAKKPDARFFAVEINTPFFESLKMSFPNERFYNDSVENVEDLCQKEGIAAVDAVISGLPWVFFSRELQLRYVSAMLRVLRPGGQFVTFGYLQGLAMPSGRRFKTTLKQHFSSVELGPVVWRNFPPAFVYRCRR